MRHRYLGAAAILLGIVGVMGTPATSIGQEAGTGAANGTAAAPEPGHRLPLLRLSADGSLSFACGFKCAFGEVGSGRLRLELPLAEHVAPWVSYGSFWVLDVYCFDFSCDYGTGRQVMLGVTSDLAGESSRAWVHPYLSAGVGRQRMERGETATTGEVGAGVLWHVGPYIAPRTEVHLERYPYAGGQLMVAAGLQVSLPRLRQ